MNNQDQMDAQARKAFWISVGIAITVTISSSVSFKDVIILLITTDTPWRSAIGLLAMVSTVSTALSSIFLCRKGRHIFGIQLLIGGLLLATALSTFAVKDGSAIFSVVIVTLIIIIATQTLPDSIATRVITIGSVIGILNVLLDLWLPLERSILSDFRAINTVGIAVIILGIVIISQYKTFKLRTKLLVMFFSIPAIIIAIVSVFFVLNITNSLKEQVARTNHADVELKTSVITSLLSTPETDILLLSNSANLAEYLSRLNSNVDANAVAEARRLLNREFLAFAQTRGIYDQVRFIDTEGQEIIRINTSQDGISTIVSIENLQNKEGRSYFENTNSLSNGKLFISPLDLNVENGAIVQPYTPVIRYGMPLFFQGERVGVVITNLLADSFLSTLSNSGTDSFLVNTDGYFLYHPDENLQWGNDLGTGITLAQEVPELAEQIFSIQDEDLDSYESPTQLFSYHPITIPGETTPRWFLADFVGIDEAFEPVREAVGSVLVVVSIGLMLTPLLAIFVSQSIAAPMLSLTRSAKKVADGDLNIEATVITHDEIGVLATTFNTMTARLRNLVGSLESRVAERTQDLALAAEVGSTVAQIRDLDELLDSAVDLIESRFNLYYVQVYLVDEKGQKLWLRAGTGEVGEKLVHRQFSLPLSPGSINSTAVFNKKPIIVADTSKSVVFRPNRLLPDTRSEIAVPLMIGDLAVGVLDLQSDEVNALSDETLPAFEALAGQLAIAIENANLFAEVAKARAEVEAQARRLIRDGWNNSLDGIHASEHIGFRYEKGQFYPLTKPLDASNANGRSMTRPITVVGESIGAIQVEGFEDDALLEENQTLIASVARQVGQQIENLRLLEDAQRYQAEAEEATRRLIRDGWTSYQSQMKADGYVYNQQEVTALQEIESAADAADVVLQPLTIQGEVVGMLELDGLNDKLDEETSGLLTAVAERLSIHLENLRLSEQSERDRTAAEKRNQEMGIINNIVTQVSASLDLQHSLQIIVDELATAVQVDQVRVALLQPNKTEMLIIAEHYDSTKSDSAVGATIPVLGNELTEEVISSRQVVIVEDAQNNPRTTPVHALFREQGIETVILMPLVVNDEVIGTIGMDLLEKRVISSESLQLAETIVYQAATAVQNARLFEQTQAALVETEMLYAYSSRLNTATSLEAVLDAAVAPGFQAGAVNASLLIYDQDANGHPEYGKIMAATSQVNGNRILLSDQPLSHLWSLQGKNILFIGNVAEDGRLRPEDQAALKQSNVQALAYMFLTTGNLKLGQIVIHWDKPQTFTNADERLYGTIAQQASSVVYNRLLFNQTEEALSETAALYQAGIDLNSAQTYAEIITALRQNTVLGKGASSIALNYYDVPWTNEQTPEWINILEHRSLLPPEAVLPRYPLAAFPSVSRILKADELTIIEDIANDKRMGDAARTLYIEQLKAKSTIFVPLVVGGRWVGHINCIYPQITTFSEQEIRRLSVLSRQAAVSIESIRLLEDTTTRAEEEQILRQVAESIHAAVDAETVMRTAVEEIGRTLGLETYIYLTEPNDLNRIGVLERNGNLIE